MMIEPEFPSQNERFSALDTCPRSWLPSAEASARGLICRTEWSAGLSSHRERGSCPLAAALRHRGRVQERSFTLAMTGAEGDCPVARTVGS